MSVRIEAVHYNIVLRIRQGVKGEFILKFFELIKGGGRGGRKGDEPPVPKQDKTYEELLDELMAWNIEHTDIVGILRKEVEEERWSKWSLALESGIRKNLDPSLRQVEDNPYLPIYQDLHRFVRGLRVKLLGSPAMKNVKPLGKSDALIVCILCGIRALQKEKGAKRPIDTLQWMMLERYLG